MYRGLLNPRVILGSLGVFLAYFIASEASLALYAAPAIFPLTAAVALAAIVLGGFELTPAIFIAGVTSYLMHGGSPIVAVGITLGNIVQACVGVYILRLLRFDPLLRRMRDIFAIGGVALFVSTIAPTFAYITFAINQQFGGNSLPITWGVYWVGDMWALLIVTPLFVRWAAKPYFARTAAEALETVAAFALMFLADYLVFWTRTPVIHGISFVYFLLIPFFWLALRFSPRFVTLGLVITSGIAFAGTTYGPAASLSTVALGDRLFQLEVFMIVIALIFYILESIANERRLAIDALRAQVLQLEIALKRISSEDLAKTEFISVLAHELRNPLAPIVSGLEILGMDKRDLAEEKRIVTMITERINVIRRLLDDLLDISRISRNKLTLRNEHVDMRALVQRSINAINELTVQKTHIYRLELSGSPIFVDGDPVRLEQVIVNLLKNAVKYTPRKGMITISLVRDGTTAILKVKDNGMGIERDMLEKIFEPFVQAGAAKVDQGGSGLGIGLSLTRRLVEMHGGTIEAKSDGTGKGSEFIVRLPTDILPIPDVHAAPEVPRKESAKKKVSRILVVDDNAAAAEGIGTLLRHKGHAAEVAFSGMEAITRTKTFRPDVILLDIGLPDVSGYEVAQMLRAAEQFSGMLVALTGYGQEEDKNRAYDAGFDYHLTKPVSIKDIEKLLARQ